MRNRIAVAILALIAGAGWIQASGAAPDSDPEKATADKDAGSELLINVTGGEPPKPIPEAEISLKSADETAIERPRRTNTKGQALFRELAKGEVTIIVIAKDWTTFKATKALAKQHEVVDVLLKPLE